MITGADKRRGRRGEPSPTPVKLTALALGLPTIATALPSYLEVGTYFAAAGTQEALELIASPLSFTDRVIAFQSNGADKFSQASVIAAWKTLLAGA